MFGNNKQTNRREKRTPDHLGSLNSCGVAAWVNDDKSVDIKIGELYGRPGSPIGVKTTFRLDNCADYLEAVMLTLSAFSHQEFVPANLRRTLSCFATALEGAIEAVAEEGNGYNGQDKARAIFG